MSESAILDPEAPPQMPVIEPESEAAEEAVAAKSRQFEPPKGFETKFKDYPLDLESFEGPLDLLLHLIREQKLDILNLPMAQVTRQYMDYLLLMEELNLEIAAEFVSMAAHLLQIKSRMLLPLPPTEEEEDPREELVSRLLEYQAMKEAAKALSSREGEWQSVIFTSGLDIQEHAVVEEAPIRATLGDLLSAYRNALKRLVPPPPVEVRTPGKTLEQRIKEVIQSLQGDLWHSMSGLLGSAATREELVLTFLALLELVRTGKINLQQSEHFGEIHVSAKNMNLLNISPTAINSQ